jgi:hypothetical protein
MSGIATSIRQKMRAGSDTDIARVIKGPMLHANTAVAPAIT